LAQPLRAQTTIETRRLSALLDPPPGPLTWYRAVLGQGWKRQLRRMFGAVGAPIARLIRVRVGSVRLDDLRTGRIRRLKPAEVRGLGVGRPIAPSGPAYGRGPSRAASAGPTARRTARTRSRAWKGPGGSA
jgi:hypothetical protein